ncbi:MAG: valine--tRNA ligase [Rhodobacteraceae bacterium]|nr:valine--tRNA ligase [Paracoccaceae bacterium]
MDKTFDAARAEARIYAEWEQSGAFKAGANWDGVSAAYSIVIPPPNVTGVLHVGHAFNNTLQDVLIRWHRMRGFDTLWQPGTDHAGIATQMVVERELAKEGTTTRQDMGRAAFLDRVWQWKDHAGGTIRAQLKRLGASCDWSREAFTMRGAPGDTHPDDGPNFHAAVIKVFVDMYNKGYIHRGKRLVNWDPHFETAISDLEVDNVEAPGHMWHFKYPLAGGATYTYVEHDDHGNVVFKEERDYIAIATTRPETMLGDGAVAVHPDDARYAPIVGMLCEIPVGPKAQRRLIPIITDDYPDPAFGSGAVKITGAHDFNDYGVAKRGNIPCYRLMDTRARLRSDGAPYAQAAAQAQKIAQEVAESRQVLSEAEEEVDALNLVPDHLRGLDRFAARKKIIAEITRAGLAVMTRADDPRLGTTGPVSAPDTMVPLVEAKQITQPYGDRSGVVIEPMLTDQWFVDTARIVNPALDAVRTGRTTIVPEQHRKVYFHWLKTIEPWCISRQLWWGHRIPVWYGLDLSQNKDGPSAWKDRFIIGGEPASDGTVQPSTVSECAPSFSEVVAKFNQRIKSLPGDLRYAKVVEVGDREEAIKCIGERLSLIGERFASGTPPSPYLYPIWQDPDVLDTWFSSGLWPIGALGWPDDTDALKRYFPTSTLVSGFDIIFFWVARMMMMQLAVVGDIPFGHVYVHALVRDEQGRKMSKSIGNVLDPLELIDEYGADALRFALVSMAAMGRDLKLSRERIKGYRNFGTKLWNAARFARTNNCTPMADFDPAAVVQTVNKWIVGEVARTRLAHDRALSAYRFNDAANGLYSTVWGKVCDWYLEFAKPLLASGDAATAAETRATMAWVIDQCLILLHPTMPFVTEALWGQIAVRPRMLIHANWPKYGAALIDAGADAELNWVISLIAEIRSVRQQMHVPAGLRVPLLQAHLDAQGQAAWGRNAALIRRLARVDSLTRVDSLPPGAVTVAVKGGVFGLPVADIIDVAREQARLEKTLGKLEQELDRLRGRLNTPKFVESAPEEVVEATRRTLATREEEQGNIRAALARLDRIAQGTAPA